MACLKHNKYVDTINNGTQQWPCCAGLTIGKRALGVVQEEAAARLHREHCVFPTQGLDRLHPLGCVHPLRPEHVGAGQRYRLIATRVVVLELSVLAHRQWDVHPELKILPG